MPGRDVAEQQPAAVEHQEHVQLELVESAREASQVDRW